MGGLFFGQRHAGAAAPCVLSRLGLYPVGDRYGHHPRAEIKRLFIESLLWGVGFSFIFTVAMRVLGIFRYEYFGPFQLLGSPIWLNFAWSPAILIFLYFRPPIRRALLFWGYLLTFCLMSAMLNEALSQLKLLNQYHWSSSAQFLVAILWFLGAALFNERYMIRFYPDQPRR